MSKTVTPGVLDPIEAADAIAAHLLPGYSKGPIVADSVKHIGNDWFEIETTIKTKSGEDHRYFLIGRGPAPDYYLAVNP